MNWEWKYVELNNSKPTGNNVADSETSRQDNLLELAKKTMTITVDCLDL